jgi:hypothetical protein
MRHIAIAAILACAAALPAAADPVAGLWRTEPGDEGGYLFVRVGPCGAEICGVIERSVGADGTVSTTTEGYEHIGRGMMPRWLEKKVAIWLAMRTSLSGDIAGALRDAVWVTKIDLCAAGEGGQRDPRASARRRAWAVGAETETIAPAPAMAAFCTISTETRLVMTRRRRSRTPSRASAPIKFVERVVPPDILARMGDPLPGCRTRGMDRAGQIVDRLMGAQRIARPRDLGGRSKRAPSGTCGKARIACARLSIPHSPQPTGPSIARRRSPSASAFASRSRAAPRCPPHLQRLDALDLGQRSTIPSLSAKPMPKSSISAGSPSSRPAWSRSR